MQASVNERELVLDMLLQITRDGEYSHIVIKNVLDKYQYLDKRERAFITRVVNGTLERMIEIDYIINQPESHQSSISHFCNFPSNSPYLKDV